jgi:membrane protease YdiL (CAAX protease family)
MTRWRVRAEVAALFLIGLAPAEFNWYYNPRLSDTPRLFWTVDLIRCLLLPAALVAWGIWRRLFTLADLGLQTRVFGRRNVFLLFATIVIVAVLQSHLDTQLLAWVSHAYPPTASSASHFSYNQMLPPSGPETGGYRLLAVVYLAISAGFSEEILFRGLLRRAFGPGLIQTAVFVVISAVAFASIHLFGGQAKAAYALGHGLAAAAIYAVTGNLWPVVVGHTMIDLYWFSAA